MEISTIGLDLAKNVFQIHGIDATGTVVVRKTLRRAQMLPFFAKLSPCLVGVEACGTSHHWARELIALGHEVRLMPPMCGRPSVGKGQTELRIAGWCGHVSGLFMRLYLPLAIMPFARTGSRSISRTRGAWVVLGFPGPAVFNRLCASAFSRPFQPLRPV